MKPFARRGLTEGERAALSPGLAEALETRGIAPAIVARPSIPALMVRLIRLRTPVMVLGQTIYWPGALSDFSAPGAERAMAVLQHELQHVLEFAGKELSVLAYVTRPHNWVYRYRLTPESRWSDFGAEQRASIVQDYWLATRGLLKDGAAAEDYRRLIPWAA